MTRTLCVALLAGASAAVLPLTAWAQTDYRQPGSQQCAVTGCNASPPDLRAPSQPDAGATQADARYAAVVREVAQVWALADSYTSLNARTDAYAHLLDLLHEQQRLHDGPKVRDSISTIEALVLWTNGVLADQKGDYWEAVVQLGNAYTKKPSLFTVANQNYRQAVLDRHLKSLPNRTVIYSSATTPDEILGAAISERVFYSAPAGVSDRVRKGFQAVMAHDWKVAKAWFEDALFLDPGNANLKSFIAIIDQPTDGTYSGQYKDVGVNFAGQPTPTRFTVADLKPPNFLDNRQLTKGLEDVIWMQFVQSGDRRGPGKP